MLCCFHSTTFKGKQYCLKWQVKSNIVGANSKSLPPSLHIGNLASQQYCQYIISKITKDAAYAYSIGANFKSLPQNLHVATLFPNNAAILL